MQGPGEASVRNIGISSGAVFLSGWGVVLGVETGAKRKTDHQEKNNRATVRRRTEEHGSGENTVRNITEEEQRMREKPETRCDGNELPNGSYMEKTSKPRLRFREIRKKCLQAGKKSQALHPGAGTKQNRPTARGSGAALTGLLLLRWAGLRIQALYE